MTHTVHPYSFRIGILRNWKSRWFGKKKYQDFLKGDVLLREWLEKRMKGMYVDSIEMERSHDTVKVIFRTSRPGLVIGRKGDGVEKLKKDIGRFLNNLNLEAKPKVAVSVEEVRHPETKAGIVAQMVAENLEKRLPFRRVMKQTVEKVMSNKGVLGVKLSLSGRLGGAEMSRKEWLKKGKMPLQTLKADIDYTSLRASLPYGDLGIKVWIYKDTNTNNKGDKK